MNYYYDPILGLSYTNYGEIILMDIAAIPSDMTIEKVMEIWKETKHLVLYSQPFESSIKVINKITSNFIK
jgi:hypothetical protein